MLYSLVTLGIKFERNWPSGSRDTQFQKSSEFLCIFLLCNLNRPSGSRDTWFQKSSEFICIFLLLHNLKGIGAAVPDIRGSKSHQNFFVFFYFIALKNNLPLIRILPNLHRQLWIKIELFTTVDKNFENLLACPQVKRVVLSSCNQAFTYY